MYVTDSLGHTWMGQTLWNMFCCPVAQLHLTFLRLPMGLHHTRLSCLHQPPESAQTMSPNQWCYPTISSPRPSCPQLSYTRVFFQWVTCITWPKYWVTSWERRLCAARLRCGGWGMFCSRCVYPLGPQKKPGTKIPKGQNGLKSHWEIQIQGHRNLSHLPGGLGISIFF